VAILNKGGNVFMERKEALNQICDEINRVEHLDRFTGRAELLKKLHHFYDLIDLYKPQVCYYGIIVNEAKTLLNELQSKMDKESKGGN
jgi:hypothetical protein